MAASLRLTLRMPLSIARPFSVSLDTSGSAASLEVWIDFERSVGDEAAVGVREVMTTFAALGSTGGLAGEQFDPAKTSMKLTASQLSNFAGHWIFEDVLIDPASSCILLNMIHWVHLEMVPVQQVRLAWRPANESCSELLDQDTSFPWQKKTITA